MNQKVSWNARRGLWIVGAGAVAIGLGAPLLAGGPTGGGQVQVPATLEDFFQPGTQPDPTGLELDPIVASTSCSFCHGEYLPPGSFEEPWDAWVATMMAQSARDPVWHAALAVANQDVNMAGEYCIRCHSPGAWLGGRSVPPDASGFIESFPSNDFDGVTCHFCHRSVNPVLDPDSPIEDTDILADLDFPPGALRGNGRYVVDPSDVRRGPYEDIAMNPAMNLHGVPVIYSPFHRRSEVCSSCHDVMNPMFKRNPDDTYSIDTLDQQHATQDPWDMFPEQATYSEWLHSQFAAGGVPFDDGRFGGNHPTGIMEECQDCHMPDTIAGGCFAWEFSPFFERQDLPAHTFAGVNHWVLPMMRSIMDDSETGLSEESVNGAMARTEDMLRAASDVQVIQMGGEIKVRVVNWSGHKLPTGYPEGRRMWLNVQFLDSDQTLTEEHGAYDYGNAVLDGSDTTVYEAEFSTNDEVEEATNVPAGTHFHVALDSRIDKDNRIPPVGFTNAGFDNFGGKPVGETYADGQHWHDSTFPVPVDAASVVVTLYYQAMTKEYIEFLRDENTTNSAGQDLYDAWADPDGGNKAPPVDMDMVEMDLTPPEIGDLDGSGTVTFNDLLILLSAWGPCPPPDLCLGDLDCSGDVGFSDLLILLANWT